MTDQQQQPPTGGTPPGDGQQQQQPPTPQTWEEILNGLPAEAKTVYESHTAGLRTALQSERTQRGELAKQIKDLSAKAEKGSESERQLQAITQQLEATTQRADFIEQAIKPEIGCTNPSLAFIAAREAGAIDQKGRVNWDAVKSAYPELFQKKVPAGNAGSGTGNPPPALGMNTFIRKAAGR